MITGGREGLLLCRELFMTRKLGSLRIGRDHFLSVATPRGDQLSRIVADNELACCTNINNIKLAPYETKIASFLQRERVICGAMQSRHIVYQDPCPLLEGSAVIILPSLEKRDKERTVMRVVVKNTDSRELFVLAGQLKGVIEPVMGDVPADAEKRYLQNGFFGFGVKNPQRSAIGCRRKLDMKGGK